MQLATRTTHAALDATRTLLSGTYRVHSILVSNTTAAVADVTLYDADDNVKAKITVPLGSTYDWTVDVIWDNGMKALAAAPSADVTVTVAHSADGV